MLEHVHCASCQLLASTFDKLHFRNVKSTVWSIKMEGGGGWKEKLYFSAFAFSRKTMAFYTGETLCSQ